MEETIYDIIGIGIGPFNLGLAALSSEIKDLQTIFFDQHVSFNWHPGMMLEGTRLQVPFHADLVTQVNPQSKYSFLSYLKAKRRLFRFTIMEEYFPLRKEYNDYCRWVSKQLDNLYFGFCCTKIEYSEQKQYYRVELLNLSDNTKVSCVAKRIILGIGSKPHIPSAVKINNERIFHSSEYLQNKPLLKDAKKITVIGSGQSAAEIFSDLLEESFYRNKTLSWFSKSERFYPMDYSKFALEMTSPDYINYFYRLSNEMKGKVLQSQSNLYKGMNGSLINNIYNRLYILSSENNFREKIKLRCNCQLINIYESHKRIICGLKQLETGESLLHQTDALILATGYQTVIPDFIYSIREKINWDEHQRYKVNRNYSIDNDNSIFVQNAELHTHGFNAPDLGMGPYRNAIILNTILGYEYFPTESDVPFQTFV